MTLSRRTLLTTATLPFIGRLASATASRRAVKCTLRIDRAAFRLRDTFRLTASLEAQEKVRLFIPLGWGGTGFRLRFERADGYAPPLLPPTEDPSPWALMDLANYRELDAGQAIDESLEFVASPTLFAGGGSYRLSVGYLAPTPKELAPAPNVLTTEDGVFEAEPISSVTVTAT